MDCLRFNELLIKYDKVKIKIVMHFWKNTLEDYNKLIIPS